MQPTSARSRCRRPPSCSSDTERAGSCCALGEITGRKVSSAVHARSSSSGDTLNLAAVAAVVLVRLRLDSRLFPCARKAAAASL